MTATVRRVEDNEFFTWLDLYTGYGEFYENPVTDEKALLVWSWLTDKDNGCARAVLISGTLVTFGLGIVCIAFAYYWYTAR